VILQKKKKRKKKKKKPKQKNKTSTEYNQLSFSFDRETFYWKERYFKGNQFLSSTSRA